MRAGCVAVLLAVVLLAAAFTYYIYIEVPKAVVFQQVPVGLAASRTFVGTVGEPCGAVAVVLSEEAAAAIEHRWIAAFDLPRFKVANKPWHETPYVPRYREHWRPSCLPAARTEPISHQIDVALSSSESFVWEDDEGIVVIDLAHRKILNEFFYK